MTEAPSPGQKERVRAPLQITLPPLTPQACEPPPAVPSQCQAGLGSREQSEEEGPASSSSGHLQQKGATSVSWSKDLISQ